MNWKKKQILDPRILRYSSLERRSLGMRAKSGGLPLAVGDWAVIRLEQKQVQAGLWDWIVLTWSYLFIAVIKPCFRYRPTLVES